MYTSLSPTHRYDDIIGLPHPVSRKHKRMSMEARAAQFAPFAALTGYDAAVQETGRLTDARIELDESQKLVLNCCLQQLLRQIHTLPEVSVTYFRPDARKEGGAYLPFCGRLRKIDTFRRLLLFADGTSLAIDDILDIEPTAAPVL